MRPGLPSIHADAIAPAGIEPVISSTLKGWRASHYTTGPLSYLRRDTLRVFRRSRIATVEHTFDHDETTRKAEARRLRREHGMPLKRTAARLGVSVASVHAWTAGIELTDEQRRLNLSGPKGPQSPDQIGKRVARWRRKNRDRRLGYQAQGGLRARERDPLHIAGCMLYWAEGSKERNRAKLANSDLQLVRMFRRFLTDALGVPKERITVRINVYLGNGLSIQQIEQHWLEALALPKSCLRRSLVDCLPTSSSGAKKNRLPYGVCTLSVHRTEVAQHLYGAIQEYAGFEEPRWLDGPPQKPRRRKPRPSAEAP